MLEQTHPPIRTTWHRKVVAALVAVAIAMMGVVAFPGAAHAAARGIGWDIGNGWLGNFTHAGHILYCAQITATAPLNNSTYDAGNQTSYNGASANDLARASWAINTYGQVSGTSTESRNWAAAVQLYVWSLVDAGTYNSDPQGGDSYYSWRAPAAQRADVRAKLNFLRATATSTVFATAAPTAGTATVSVQMFDSYNGQVTVTATPASAVGVLTLTGATVTDTGETAVAVTNGSVIAITGAPLDSEGKYRVEASAEFSLSHSGHYGAVRLWRTPGLQDLVGAPTVPPAVRWSSNEYVSDPIDTVFEPVVTTTVSNKQVEPGEPLTDVLVAGLSSTSPATAWRQWEDTTTYMPIVAKGTLYGPLADPPAPSATVPATAPVAFTTTVTLNGPGSYTSPAFTPTMSGYYTWVWSIDQSDQAPLVAAFVTDGYSWQHDYGLIAETSVASITLEATTAVVEPVLGLFQAASDTLTVTHDPATGPWVTVDGVTPASAHFTGTAYWWPGSVAPTQQPDAPSTAEVLGTREFTAISRPGTYTTTPLEVPKAEPGFVVWQWELVPAEGSPFVPWRDDWGVPSEVTQYVPPVLSTEALPVVAVTDSATDTATIGGEAMGAATELTFALYGPVDVDDVVCDASTLVSDGLDAPVRVTTPGQYVSGGVQLDVVGTYAWVATLWDVVGGTVLAEGECGEPSELTSVELFTASTRAVQTVTEGDSAYDVAQIVGPVAEGVTIRFDAFLQEGDGAAAVCDATNRITAADEELIVVDGEGEYRSRDVRLDVVGTYFWVETIFDRDGNVLHEGVCGELLERTTVTVLPPTGLSAAGLWIAGGTAIAAGLLFLAVWRFRRQEQADS